MPMLTWMGREKMLKASKSVPTKILCEERDLSCVQPGAADAENILVHGDNLEALQALLPFYAGCVKCIYIDPPYNTGSAFEHYDDNLEHATWLNMMYPRLKLLREFLREDGSIWISIDDDEQAYMKVMCDEIFGRQNFLTTIVWQKRFSRENREAIGDSHEYILVYVRDKDLFKETRNLLPLTEKQRKAYKNPDHDPRGPWQSVSLLAQGYRPNQMYEIVAPNGTIHRPPAGNCWKVVESEYKKALADNRVTFGNDGTGVPRRKQFLAESKGIVPWSWWPQEEVGHTGESKKEVIALFGAENPFETPKPERLIQRILEIATNPGDLVLDSFLGSGTTAAVAHKMGRRWVGIEMGEHARTHCAVRLRRVVEGEQGGISKSVKWQGGGGFRFYELGAAILRADGTLTADIPFETMAAHVWFTETKRPYAGFVGGGNKTTVLGVHKGAAYALLYNGILGDKRVGGGNVLTKRTLKVIEDDLETLLSAVGVEEIEKLVVYAEACRLSSEALDAAKIDFCQTPYDLVVRK